MTPTATGPILFITQNYAPEPIGSGPYITEMAEYLAEQGAEVVALTCRPHYPDGAVPAAWRAGNRDRERIGGVTVERVKPFLSKRRGFIGRALGEYAFFLRAATALVTRRVRRASTVVSVCPSILAVLLGAFARRRGGRHVVVVHDIQSGLAEGLSMVRTRWILRVMRHLERYAFNRADQILVLSDEMGDRLRTQGVTVPIETLPIWVDTGAIRPLPSTGRATPTILYSGNLGRKQALDQIIDMAGQLKARGSAARIVLRGNGSEARRLAEMVADRDLDNVAFAPLVPRERLSEGLAEGDIHLVTQDGRAADFAVPSKVFGIMAAGRSFVAAAPPGSQLWRLRDHSQAFLCVPSGDVDALTEAVTLLADDPILRDRLGRNGRAFAVAEHDRKLVLDRFAASLRPRAATATLENEEHLLIFEPDPRGHAREWLEHLIDRIAADPRPIRATLAIPQDLADSLRSHESHRLAIRPLSPGEMRYCNHPRLAVSGFARWWAMRRHVKAAGATRAVFLGLDHLTLPLGLGLSVAGRPVSGILFRPCTHYEALGCGGRPTLKERVRDLRKDVLTALTARNASVDRIFSLDPYFPRFAAERYRNGHKVVPIWDPAFPAPCPDSADRTVTAGLPGDRMTFVLFGEITERKGIFALLSAAARLPEDIADRIAIVIAGRIDPQICQSVHTAAASVRETAPSLWLQLIDRRLGSGEIAALVERSDVVLLPYQRFVGSSGVLLWAARFNRPVICQDYGLIGVLTRNFGLGVTVDTSDPDALAAAIAQAAGSAGSLPYDPAGMHAFIEPRRPEIFAGALLGADG